MKLLKPLLLAILAITITAATSSIASATYQVKIEKDITFATHGDNPLKAILYQPIDAPAPSPAILFIHGGGFMAGDINDAVYQPFLSYFAQHGYTVLSINYRLLDKGGIFPNNVKDVKCGLAWFKNNASRLGVDTSRIAVMGESAGGHLAAMLALTPAEAFFAPDCEAATTADLSVKAAVLYYSPFNFDSITKTKAGIAPVLEVTMKSFKRFPNKAAFAEYKRVNSPITYVNNAPPIIIQTADPDSLVPTQQAFEMEAALKAAGKTVTHKVYTGPGMDHAFMLMHPETDAAKAALKDSLDFLDKHLGVTR